MRTPTERDIKRLLLELKLCEPKARADSEAFDKDSLPSDQSDGEDPRSWKADPGYSNERERFSFLFLVGLATNLFLAF